MAVVIKLSWLGAKSLSMQDEDESDSARVPDPSGTYRDLAFIDPLEAMQHLVINPNGERPIELHHLHQYMGKYLYEAMIGHIIASLKDAEAQIHTQRELAQHPSIHPEPATVLIPYRGYLRDIIERGPRIAEVFPNRQAMNDAITIIYQGIADFAESAANNEKTWVKKAKINHTGVVGRDAFTFAR